MRKPFWYSERQCWYVKDHSGRKIRLDPDEEIAFEMWHRMREVGNIHDQSSFAALGEAWMQEHEHLIDAEKFGQHASYVARFGVFVKGKLARDVTRADVMKWLLEPKLGRLRAKREKDKKGRLVKVLDDDGKPIMEHGPSKVWSKSTQADAGHAIKRVFDWAHSEGKLTRNPLAKLRLSQGESRKTLITLEQHRQCLAATSPGFRAYLIASRCGARPRQIREVEARHVHTLPDGRMIWAFDPTEHKGERTGKHLVVYLSPCMATLTRILMAARKSGPLFRNEDGNPWLSDTVSMTMRRLRDRVGVEAVTVYAYRHSFATDALMAGHSLAVVAELLGHADTRMVGKVYGHLDQQKAHLLDAVSDTQRKRLG